MPKQAMPKRVMPPLPRPRWSHGSPGIWISPSRVPSPAIRCNWPWPPRDPMYRLLPWPFRGRGISRSLPGRRSRSHRRAPEHSAPRDVSTGLMVSRWRQQQPSRASIRNPSSKASRAISTAPCRWLSPRPTRAGGWRCRRWISRAPSMVDRCRWRPSSLATATCSGISTASTSARATIVSRPSARSVRPTSTSTPRSHCRTWRACIRGLPASYPVTSRPAAASRRLSLTLP